jgi:hypothetical protein
MTVGRALAIGAVAAIVCLGPARAEEPAAEWEYAVWAAGYAIPDASNLFNPNVSADSKRVHLEARYAYEAPRTASLWGGANFSAGTKWEFNATVMGGVVFGDLEGVAPGYRVTASRAWFEFASEGEYYIDVHDRSGDFLYDWTEASGRPVSWCRLGLAAQRTRAYETGLSTQRGFLAGFTVAKVDLTGYVFNLGWESPTYVLIAAFTF